MAKIQPLQDRVIVKRFESEEKTASGIFIPDCEVIAVGAGKYLDNGNIIKPTVKAGDKVLFSKYAGTEVKIDGQDLLIMREDDILGIIG